MLLKVLVIILLGAIILKLGEDPSIAKSLVLSNYYNTILKNSRLAYRKWSSLKSKN